MGIPFFAYAFSRERKKLLSGQVTFLPQLTKKAKLYKWIQDGVENKRLHRKLLYFILKVVKKGASPVQKY